ncbi:MAG: ABC transporter ATP-binding protein, partial [Acidobacteriota bacterium]|nr:ABC transporter ATP-binding protein [Acidobacteriota bacterium]
MTEHPTMGSVQPAQPLGLPGVRVAAAAVDPRDAILEVRNLRTSFPTGGGFVHAVDNVSFNVRKGEALALVGESG